MRAAHTLRQQWENNHLHEGESERVPAAPQQSLTFTQRFVIQSDPIYLGREKFRLALHQRKVPDFLILLFSNLEMTSETWEQRQRDAWWMKGWCTFKISSSDKSFHLFKRKEIVHSEIYSVKVYSSSSWSKPKLTDFLLWNTDRGNVEESYWSFNETERRLFLKKW